VTRNPEEFCRRTYAPAVPYRDWLEVRHKNSRGLFDSNNLASEFLDWLLDNHLSTPDDLGRPVRSPEHWNPVTRLSRKAQSIQTHREAIPTRYINEMIRILTEADFALAEDDRIRVAVLVRCRCRPMEEDLEPCARLRHAAQALSAAANLPDSDA
jgi:hypothetical protein